MSFRFRFWASLCRHLAPAACLYLCGWASALPVLTVTAEMPIAHESGPTPGLFKFTRTGDVSMPLSAAFSLSGTAARDTDYLIWEPTAEFPAGSDTAWVAVLPRNDSRQEGDESVMLSLQGGTGYSVGAPSQATVAIRDAYVSGYPGVWDTLDRDPQTGRHLTEADFAYLDAAVADSALTIQVRFNDMGSYADFALYIDSDQNPLTGDYRQGRVGGQEYRINFDVQLTNKWYLYKLRTYAPLDPLEDEQIDELVGSGTVISDATQKWAALSIPVTMLKNRQRFDVFAVTCPGLNVNTPGQGDRCPDYGAFDTYARQVVVRSPGVTQHVSFSDPAGDAVSGGFDVTGVSYTSIAGQFSLALTFTQAFDPSDDQYSTGPFGFVTVDGDRDLLTGCFGIGGAVPTFGGDNIFAFNVGSVMLPSTLFYIQTDSTRAKQYFGGDRNDATWLCYAPQNALYISGSLSLLDAFRKTMDGGLSLTERIPSDGNVRLEAETWNLLSLADKAPPGGAAFDSPTATALPAYQWDAARTITATDPLDFGGLDATDITRVDAEVVDGNLVVKGTLSSWMNSDVGNRMEIGLDTDMDAATGAPVNNPESGGPAIGVDYLFTVNSVEMAQDASVGYFGMLTPYGAVTTRHDAAIAVRVNSSFSDPGWFTATIPLRALEGVGTKVRFYVRSGDVVIPGGDTAPPAPMVISTTPSFTLADAGTALRISGGLAVAGDTRLNVDGIARVTITDAVHLARKVAGLETNP